MTGCEILTHDQKLKRAKDILNTKKAILVKAQAAWKKAWAEKSPDLREVYEAVTDASGDVMFYHFQVYLFNKP